MTVHGSIVFRHFLEEIDQIRNIREHFDPCLHHGSDLVEIIVSLQDFLHIGKRFLIECVRIHFLNIFSVHPAQLRDIEHCRRFADVVIVKRLHKFRKSIDLSVLLGAPAQKSHEVHNSLRKESLLHQILVGGMTGTLAQLLVLLVGDQRAVYIHRNLPAESLINTVILRRGGKVFVSSYHMGDPHQMVVHNVGEVIGGVSVGFDQDQILHLLIIDRDITVDHIMESGCSLCGHIETDHMGFPSRKTSLHFLPGKMQTALVINGNLLACHHALHGLQFLRSAEAIVSVSLLDQLLRIFQIDAGSLSLALDIRADAAVFIRSFIVEKAGALKSAVDNIHCALHISLLVCVLYS